MGRGVLGGLLAGLVACGDPAGEPAPDATGDVADTGDATEATTVTGADGASGEDSGAVGDRCEPGPSPQVWLGHGDGSFVDFSEGAATIVYGVQGGYHIVVGLQAQHLDASDLAVARLRGSIDGVEMGASAPYAALECRDAMLEALGLLLIWDVPPPELHQRTVQVDVELTDVAGTVVSSSAEVVVIDPRQG